jgi:hypothetical protein
LIAGDFFLAQNGLEPVLEKFGQSFSAPSAAIEQKLMAADRNLSLIRLKFQGSRIHAVAQAGGRRAIVKHMAQVGPTVGAMHLGTGHPEGAIDLSFNILRGDRLPKTGPTGSRIVFGI